MAGSAQSLATLVTSQLAQALYDPLRNDIERATAQPTIARAIQEQPDAPAPPTNVSVQRPVNMWPWVLGIGALFLYLMLSRR